METIPNLFQLPYPLSTRRLCMAMEMEYLLSNEELQSYFATVA